MRSSRKRSAAELDTTRGPEEVPLLDRIRGMWQFANLCQWIYLFGKAVRIPEDFDVEVCDAGYQPLLFRWAILIIIPFQLLEAECLRPQSTVLRDVGLALLKFVSSHRGLT